MNATVRNYAYGLSLFPGVLVVYGNLHGGLWTLGNMFYSLLVLSVIDICSKAFTSPEHGDDIIPTVILWLHVPLQLVCIGTFVYGVKHFIITDNYIWYATLSMSIYSGSGAIVVAHEFIHRKQTVLQFAGKLLLFTTGNIYFFIEHLHVHHKWVGTTKDSATARRGQSVYGFFITSVFGQVCSAWILEKTRCIKAGKLPFGFSNYMVRQLFFHLIFGTVLFVMAGSVMLLAWFVHCILANFLLEYVNYIEHYGLERNENERATEQHSWQSDRLMSRFVLIDLSRHADHHYYASKPFHTLESYKQSPVLPLGYPGLIIPALIPPLWRKLIHPILDGLEHNKK